MLMGGVTYDHLAEISASGEHEGVSRMAELPKVVFSNTLEEPLSWATPASSAASSRWPCEGKTRWKPTGTPGIPATWPRSSSCPSTTGVFDGDQHMDASQPDGVHGQEVTGDDPVGLGGQELLPPRAGTPRCRVGSGGGQDLPHRRRGDPVTEPGQLALGSAMPHSGLSAAMRATRRRIPAAVGGRPGRRRRLWSQRRATRRRCQRRRVAGVTGKTCPQRDRGSRPDRAASHNRSAGSYRTRTTSRRGTAF
jgi:hypothetical protein